MKKIILGLLLTSGIWASDIDDSEWGYPTPPWTRSVTALRTSFNQYSAKALAESAVQNTLRQYAQICSTNGGTFSSRQTMAICTPVGTSTSQMWNCQANGTAFCKVVED